MFLEYSQVHQLCILTSSFPYLFTSYLNIVLFSTNSILKNIGIKGYNKTKTTMEDYMMLNSSMLYPRVTKSRRVLDMNDMWKFKFDPDSTGKENNWAGGLPTAELMPVPASFADFFTDKDSREYVGDFWYETEFVVPGEWQGKEVGVRFGCATHRATVFINGEEIAFHEGGFLPFTVNITNTARYNEVNRLSVLVNNELREDCIPVGKTATLPNGKKVAKPYFDFYNYSGLQRPVKLIALPKEHITDFTVNHFLDGTDAEVAYTVETTHTSSDAPTTLKVTVFDEDGQLVADSVGTDGRIRIENAHLWQPLNAYLYKFVIQIMNNDTIIDEYTEEIGIRTVSIKGIDFLINDKPVYLKGFGKHEDSDIIGRGYNPGVIKRDFELMKWIGANSFRTAHYPYSEEIYQMADREGFLIIDETPAVGLMASTVNFFDAAMGKQTAFFERDTIPTLLDNHLNALRDLIKRDKNHASVIAWCLLNEPESTDDAALPYIEKVFEEAQKLDVQKRPRTFANLMSAQPDLCKCYQLCDFVSLNRYYGWYILGGYELGTAELAFHAEMAKWKEKDLNVPFIFSEYGADTDGSLHKLPSVMWSQEFQNEYLEMSHRVFDSYDFVKGEHVWNFADFQTTEGTMRLDGNKKGIFTRQRQPKASAYYFKKRWENLSIDFKSKK